MCAGSAIAADSVISAMNWPTSAPSKRASRRSAKPVEPSWRGETLNAMSGRRPSSPQALACAITASTTQSPIGSIRPLSSAAGMKSPGGIIPRSGSFQRSSASTATASPLATSQTGW